MCAQVCCVWRKTRVGSLTKSTPLGATATPTAPAAASRPWLVKSGEVHMALAVPVAASSTAAGTGDVAPNRQRVASVATSDEDGQPCANIVTLSPLELPRTW